jgi:hypothetical protein
MAKKRMDIRALGILIFTCVFFMGAYVYGHDLQGVISKSETLEYSKSEKAITGKYSALNLNFSSAVEKDGYIIVDLRLRDDKQLIAKINYMDETFNIKFIALKSGKPVTLGKEDLHAFHLLHAKLQQHFLSVDTKVIDALLSVLNLLEGYPPGEFLDVSSASKQIKPEAWTSLCESIGETVTGTYTIGSTNYNEEETVGPCGSGDCLGRCGLGCEKPPPPTLQRFTQECLNHDLCAGATGKWLGPCRDEWDAAVSGFLFATDCENVTGVWNDTYGSVWMLTQIDTSVRGTVETLGCGTWHVTGSNTGFNLILTARNIPPIEEECCTAYTYTGTVYCNTASATWTNECGLSGSWSMTKSSSATESVAIPNNQGPSPASSR